MLGNLYLIVEEWSSNKDERYLTPGWHQKVREAHIFSNLLGTYLRGEKYY